MNQEELLAAACGGLTSQVPVLIGWVTVSDIGAAGLQVLAGMLTAFLGATVGYFTKRLWDNLINKRNDENGF